MGQKKVTKEEALPAISATRAKDSSIKPGPSKILEKERGLLEGTPIISDAQTLLRYGIVKVRLPKVLGEKDWAKELSQVTPQNMFMEGDGEYAFYRNIVEEPDFPFHSILHSSKTENDDDSEQLQCAHQTSLTDDPPKLPLHAKTEIASALTKYFPVKSTEEDIRLDDAFCVHYNTSQYDTSGAKHVDPSDITINMCLEKTKDVTGSCVMFYGTKSLDNIPSSDGENDEDPPERFLVAQDEGYATIHYGNHSHQTMSLSSGRRTNIILTYCFTDHTRSDVATRTCY